MLTRGSRRSGRAVTHQRGSEQLPMPRLVTLTTDFGARDPYVAAMKGALLDGCPGLQLVDLSHEIAAHDVLEGALFLEAAVPYFPAGTVHLVVVDPGVGSDRRALAASVLDQVVVCPDSGVLTLLARAHGLDEVRAIESPEFRRAEVSRTFHGRDIFAPAAARLACGAPLGDAGPRLERIVELPVPEPVADGSTVRGEVIHVDRFGNLITNL